jgi:hypothetical protein
LIFAREAVQHLIDDAIGNNPTVNLEDYANSSGWINNVFILFAGTKGGNSIWPHGMNLYGRYYNEQPCSIPILSLYICNKRNLSNKCNQQPTLV